MITSTILGLLIPFIGTSLGAACVLFMKNELSVKTTKMLSGFAAGVMIAASVWSLLIPALEQSQSLGKMQFVPAVTGFMLGMFFLLILDTITPHMHLDNSVEGPKSNFSRQTMMVLAVTLHNIPEGMAVGVLYASWISGTTTITRAAALSLAIGIAIQNFPEGAIISMPLHSTGSSKLRAFVYGVLSGIVEPIAGILTILAIGIIEPVMPYLLSFAAGNVRGRSLQSRHHSIYGGLLPHDDTRCDAGLGLSKPSQRASKSKRARRRPGKAYTNNQHAQSEPTATAEGKRKRITSTHRASPRQ